MAITVRNHARAGRVEAEEFEATVESVVRPPGVVPGCRRLRVVDDRVRSSGPCLSCPRRMSLMPCGGDLVIACRWSSDDPVDALMDRPPLPVQSSARIADARSLLTDTGDSHVLVVDADRLLGVVSAAELESIAGDAPVASCLPGFTVWVVEARQTLGEAAALMASKSVDCLPVVDGRELRGVIKAAQLRRCGFGG